MPEASSIRILVMRHAEKPGDPQDPHLSAAGQARAQKLADFIPSQYGTPDALFAAALSRHSARSSETLEPLSNRSGVPIDSTFADQDHGALVEQIFETKRLTNAWIVICWHHGNLPALLNALGARAGEYPDPWNPDVFNLILQLEYGTDGFPQTTEIVEPF